MERPSPFLLHGWLVEWWRHYGEGGELRVHLARRGDRLVGALPLDVRRRRGLRVAGFVGGDLTNFADVLAAAGEGPDVAAALVAQAAAGGHDYARLGGLTSRSRIGAVGGLRLVERAEAPVLDLSAGWDAVYRAKTSSKKRNLHKRRRRQLEEAGAVGVRVLRTAAELDDVLDETFRLHELRWEGRYDGSGYATETGRRFHRAAIRRLAETDVPRIVTLDLDGRPIAFHYYFALCGRMYVHRLAFDPAYGRYSPGVLNTLDAIEAAAAEGVERVEFMGGADRYKLELADGIDPMHHGFGLATTARGRVAAAAGARGLELRRRLKRSERLRAAYLRLRARGAGGD
jgi:CelD/BcsL family acetyltransferase involved in cellulose biosynthesis